MKARKLIAVRFGQMQTGHGLTAQYLKGIGKKDYMCGHEYQTRDHLFLWYKIWKKEQDVLYRSAPGCFQSSLDFRKAPTNFPAFAGFS